MQRQLSVSGDDKKGAHEKERKFTLFLPDDYKKDIFNILKALDKENKPISVKAKDQLKKFAVWTKLAKPIDLEAKWDKCVEEVVESKPETDRDFGKRLMDKIKSYFPDFYLSSAESDVSCSLEKKLQNTIITGVVQNLFSQFEKEQDIYLCAQSLFKMVTFPYAVWRDKINTEAFENRILDQWKLLNPLMINEISSLLSSQPSHVNYHAKELLWLTENDFTFLFFSQFSFPIGIGLEQKNKLLFLGKDTVSLIENYFSVEDLSAYRQVSRTQFHVVENNSTFRMRHRLDLISKSKFMGCTIFQNNNYLLTNPKGKSHGNGYRLTELTSPFRTTTFHFDFKDSRPIKGKYMMTNEHDTIKICIVEQPYQDLIPNGDHFIMYQYSFSQADITRFLGFAKKCIINLDRKDFPQNPSFCPTHYQTTLNFKAGENSLTLNFTLEEFKKVKSSVEDLEQEDKEDYSNLSESEEDEESEYFSGNLTYIPKGITEHYAVTFFAPSFFAKKDGNEYQQNERVIAKKVDFRV